MQTIIQQVHGSLAKSGTFLYIYTCLLMSVVEDIVCKESRKLFEPIKEQFANLQVLLKDEQQFRFGVI